MLGGQALGNRRRRSPALWIRWGGNARLPSIPPSSQAGSHNVLTTRSLDVQLLADRLDLVAKPLVFLQLVGDLFNRVKRFRVVAPAERFADRGKRRGRLFADQEHRDLARKNDVLVPPFALHIVERDVVVIGCESLDPLHVDRLAGTRWDDVGEKPRRLVLVDLTLVHRGKGLDSRERALE